MLASYHISLFPGSPLWLIHTPNRINFLKCRKKTHYSILSDSQRLKSWFDKASHRLFSFESWTFCPQGIIWNRDLSLLHRILIEAGLAESCACQELLINLPSCWASQSLCPKTTLRSDWISCMIVPKDTVLAYLLRYWFIILSCISYIFDRRRQGYHKEVRLYLLMKHTYRIVFFL